ncbi:MAG: pilus assembly protein PilM [Chitinispirillia bacterium]|nr:pilus assembly protein PilM [Chitinispirillia bacterium]MCL2241903.1 pilus assembly protein PilM [Chitinispirillia bacterium]
MAKSIGTNGIDIQRNYLCVVQYSSRDASVRQVAIQPLPVSADLSAGSSTAAYWDAVTAGLRVIRRNMRFAGSDAACSLPCDMAVARALEAESDEPDQTEALRWELEASLGGPVSGYAYDFYEVDPGHLVDRRRYIAAAVRTEAISKLNKAVKAAKLRAPLIDIDLFALTHTFQANYRERLGEASILVHGELHRTKLILVYNSSYVDHRVADFNVEGRGAAEYAAMLRYEASLLMASGASVTSIANDGDGAAMYLAGALFTDRAILTALLGALPRCEMLDPFRKVVCAVPGMESEEVRTTHSPQLAVAVGLALRGEESA